MLGSMWHMHQLNSKMHLQMHYECVMNMLLMYLNSTVNALFIHYECRKHVHNSCMRITLVMLYEHTMNAYVICGVSIGYTCIRWEEVWKQCDR